MKAETLEFLKDLYKSAVAELCDDYCDELSDGTLVETIDTFTMVGADIGLDFWELAADCPEGKDIRAAYDNRKSA